MTPPISNELLPAGHPNRPGTKLSGVRAIVFHYTGNDAPAATDTMNALYFGRKWMDGADGKPYEVKGQLPVLDSAGRMVPFRYGSTQLIADMDSVTRAMPEDEVAWACGDRPLPYTQEFKGQKPCSRYVFSGRPNYLSLSIEICSNDVIKGSSEDWDGACSNAAQVAVDYLRSHAMTVNTHKSKNPDSPDSCPAYGEVLLLRHYDVSGKVCPKPFVDDQEAWYNFIDLIAASV